MATSTLITLSKVSSGGTYIKVRGTCEAEISDILYVSCQKSGGLPIIKQMTFEGSRTADSLFTDLEPNTQYTISLNSTGYSASSISVTTSEDKSVMWEMSQVEDISKRVNDKPNIGTVLSSTSSVFVNTSNIANNAVTSAKLASDSVTSDKIASGAIGTSKIENNAITTDKILDEVITFSKLSSSILDYKSGYLGSNTELTGVNNGTWFIAAFETLITTANTATPGLHLKKNDTVFLETYAGNTTNGSYWENLVVFDILTLSENDTLSVVCDSINSASTRSRWIAIKIGE